MASNPPSDQHNPSSMLSRWPVRTFNNPFPGPLEEELENSTAVMSVSSSPQPLSSQTSTGGSTTKVSKRRSRSAIKPPIRVVSADRSTFRDMVQKLTGIPTSLCMEGNGFQQTWGNNPSALIKSMATRSNSQDDAVAAHSLHTLDTSSAYLLLNGPSQKAVTHDEINSNNDFSFLQSLQHPQPHMTAAAAGGGGGSLNAALYNELYYYNPSSSGGAIDLKSLFVSQYAASKGTNMHSEGVGGEVSPNMEHLDRIRQAAELESFLLMGNDKLDDVYPSRMLHNVQDSWLSSDAMELAHSA